MLWCESCGYCRPTPEIEDEPGNGQVARGRRTLPACVGQEARARRQNILIANHHVEHLPRAPVTACATWKPPAPLRSPSTSSPSRNSHPRLPADALQGTRDLVQPALDVPAAELRLDVGDDVERGGCPVRRRTVVGGKAVEKLDEMRIVPEEPAHDLVHRLKGSDLRQVPQLGQVLPFHLPPPFLQRMMQKSVRAQVVQPARVRQEPRHVRPLPERGVLVDDACRPSSGSGR